MPVSGVESGEVIGFSELVFLKDFSVKRLEQRFELLAAVKIHAQGGPLEAIQKCAPACPKAKDFVLHQRCGCMPIHECRHSTCQCMF